MKELGDKFTYRSKVLNADETTAWRTYSDAVQKAKDGKGDNRAD